MSHQTDKLYRDIEQSLGRMTKNAFTPMPPQQGQPPMDPAMMGAGGGGGGGGGMPPMPPQQGQPPMDPAMMGAGGGGGGMPPIDPAMMEQMLGEGGPPPADPGMMGGGAPESPSSMDQDQIRQVIREELADAGVIKEKKLSPKDQMQWLHDKLDALFKHMNIPTPPQPGLEGEGGEDSKSKDKEQSTPDEGSSAVMGPGTTGQSSDLPAGSLQDQQMDLSSIGGGLMQQPPAEEGQPTKSSYAKPGTGDPISDAIARLRG